MIRNILVAPLATIIIALSYSAGIAEGVPPDNKHALQGVQATKTVFDVNVGKADKLLLYLTVIRKTYRALAAEGIAPELVIAFRGASVRLLTTETWSFEEEDQASLDKARAILKEFKDTGIRLEVCSVATDLHKVNNNTVLPELTLVGNTFVSLIGYQSKGYALIPIH